MTDSKAFIDTNILVLTASGMLWYRKKHTEGKPEDDDKSMKER